MQIEGSEACISSRFTPQADTHLSSTANVSPPRLPPLCPWCDYDSGMLLCVAVHHPLHLVLVQEAEREKGGNQGSAGIQEAREPGMVRFNGSRKPGVHILSLRAAAEGVW